MHQYKIRIVVMTLTALSLLASCQQGAFDDDVEIEANQPSTATINQFINLTISVAGESMPVTRGPGDTSTSQGGEDGDGREAGFARENAINSITLILTDQPLSNDAAQIKFIKRFLVSRVDGTTQTVGTDRSEHLEETQYTTGNQYVPRDELDMTQSVTYHAIVVANRYVDASVGDLLSTALRDQTLAANMLFNGDGYNPDGCDNFAMTSEQDVTVDFTDAADVTHTVEGNNVIFSVTQPIIIERLAARIDFCTAYSGGTANAAFDTYNVTVGESATTVSGFRYETTTPNNYFILESITPFNIAREPEYLFKRTATGWTESAGVYTPASTDYFADETTTSYVVDPLTASKLTATLDYANPLGATEPDWSASPYRRTATSLDAQTSKTRVSSATTDDNFIVAYATENTLLPASPLGAYATGLAITGSYYDAAGNQLGRKTFYGYLRHQAEGAASFRAYEWADLPKGAPAAGAPAMNFGIVRNNLYRVNIESVDAAGGWITITLQAKNWRHVDNPTINF